MHRLKNARDELREWEASPSRPLRNKPNAKITPAMIANVLAMVKQGRPFKKIARDMHIDVCTVTSIRKRHGDA